MKIGILGGAFDPLHSEHIRLIDECKKKLALDKIILVPSYNPPHKSKDLCSYEERVAMLHLYAKGKDYIAIDQIENELQLQNSYTYVILPQLIAKYPNDELFFLVGGDSMYRFATWVEPQIIANLIPIAVVLRKGYDCTSAVDYARKTYNARITVLADADLKAISSTELKCRLELDYQVEDYILPQIAQYITVNKLYKQFAKEVAFAKSRLTERTYFHCVRTAIFAAKYAGILGLDYKKTFLASFLHDIAKCSAPLQSEYPTNSAAIIHQYDGATVAQMECGIKDADVLLAIKYHSTGRANMSLLAQLIYVADKLEDNRCYQGVAELRLAVEQDFESGFRQVVKYQHNYLVSTQREIDGLTSECNTYYNTKMHN